MPRKSRVTKSGKAQLEAEKAERERTAQATPKANNGFGLLQPTTPAFAEGMMV